MKIIQDTNRVRKYYRKVKIPKFEGGESNYYNNISLYISKL